VTGRRSAEISEELARIVNHGISWSAQRVRLLAMKQHHFLWALVYHCSPRGTQLGLGGNRAIEGRPRDVCCAGRRQWPYDLDFTIDSGPRRGHSVDVLSTLARTGTIAKSDYVGIGEYQLADGKAVRSRRIRLRSVRVGSVEITDVVASETSRKPAPCSWDTRFSVPTTILGYRQPAGCNC